MRSFDGQKLFQLKKEYRKHPRLNVARATENGLRRVPYQERRRPGIPRQKRLNENYESQTVLQLF
jgi:hypothetical protein